MAKLARKAVAFPSEMAINTVISPKPVDVIITPGRGKPPTVSRDPVILRKDEVVRWQCSEDFVVYFRDEASDATYEPGSPFKRRYFYLEQPESGPVRGDVMRAVEKNGKKKYKYKYWIECAGFPLDPDVIIVRR